MSFTEAQNCGFVQICIQNLQAGHFRIFFTVSLNSELPGRLQSVTVSGYTFNFISESVRILSAPGSAPNVEEAAKVYTDFWDGSTESGDVQIGFPFLRGYSDDNSFCFGNFRHIFTPSKDSGTVCEGQPMYRSQKVDFALVVDTTGSMRDDIEAVKTDATRIVSTLSSISKSFRGAVVEYNDRESGPDATILQSFTLSTPTLLAAINALTATGGGDYAECLYDGLALALALPWDNSARRVTITMGDAPGKVCDSKITQADVLSIVSFADIDIDISPKIIANASFKESTRQTSRKISVKLPVKGITPLYMIGAGREPSEFKELAAETGGRVISVDNATKVASAIENAIKAGPEKPKLTKDLSLTLDCKASTLEVHVFSIQNSNDFEVPYVWQNLFVKSRKSGTAIPGITTIRDTATSRIFITLKWDKAESGETGSIVYTPKACD